MTGTISIRRAGRALLGPLSVRWEGAPDDLDGLHDLPAATIRRLRRSEARMSLRQGVHILAAYSPQLQCSDDELRTLLDRRLEMERVAPQVETSLARLNECGVEEARSQLSDVARATDHLDDHQVVGCASLTAVNSWGACLFDEQGTGKTVTTMSAYDVLRQRLHADILIVVAPKSMIHEWKAEFTRFYGPRYAVAVVAGSDQERTTALHSRADVYVLSYEAVARHETALLTLVDGRRAVLAVDESFFVKNPDAGRTQSVMRLRLRCDRGWVLCGTPAPNHPRDLVAQFDLVDLGRTFGDLTVPEDRAEAAFSLAHTLRTAAWTRSRKDDVLDLPARQFEDIVVPMSPLQRSLYEATAEDLLEELRGLTESEFARRRTHYLQRRSALLQLASNPATVVTDYDEVPNKWRVLESRIRHFASEGEKVVLWSFYRRSIRRLTELFNDLDPVVVDGSIESQDRRAAVRSFQSDSSVRLFIGNPAAAGAGLTLHAARYAVYESFSNQAAHFLQSLDRIHRRGQSREVLYQVFLSDSTLEVAEYERLLDKAQRQATLLGDGDFPGIDRATMLADLSGVADG